MKSADEGYHCTVSFYPGQNVRDSSQLKAPRRFSGSHIGEAPLSVDHLLPDEPPSGYDRSQFCGSSSDEEEDGFVEGRALGRGQNGRRPRSSTLPSISGNSMTARVCQPGSQADLKQSSGGTAAAAAPAPAGLPPEASEPGPPLGFSAVRQGLDELLRTASHAHMQLCGSRTASSGDLWQRSDVRLTEDVSPPELASGTTQVARALSMQPVSNAIIEEHRNQSDKNLASSAAATASQLLTEPQQRPHLRRQPSSQQRGPLEALRDELLGPSSGTAHVSGSTENAPVQAKRPAAYGMDASGPAPTTAQLGLSGALPPDGTDRGGPWLSPTPSGRAAVVASPCSPMPLLEEQSTITSHAVQSVGGDISSIYSMPESALTALVAAQTPGGMSFTTAAVSELDTPSSGSSHGDGEAAQRTLLPYHAAAAGGTAALPPSADHAVPASAAGNVRTGGRDSGFGFGSQSRGDLSSGYDDYEAPTAWMPLRERHSAASAATQKQILQTPEFQTQILPGPRAEAVKGGGELTGGASAEPTPLVSVGSQIGVVPGDSPSEPRDARGRVVTSLFRSLSFGVASLGTDIASPNAGTPARLAELAFTSEGGGMATHIVGSEPPQYGARTQSAVQGSSSEPKGSAAQASGGDAIDARVDAQGSLPIQAVSSQAEAASQHGALRSSSLGFSEGALRTAVQLLSESEGMAAVPGVMKAGDSGRAYELDAMRVSNSVGGGPALVTSPWMDSATAAAAASGSSFGRPASLPRGTPLALMLMASHGGTIGGATADSGPASGGGASVISAISAAVVGSVPDHTGQQDRAERVRSWATLGADFAAAPQSSSGGAPLSGTEAFPNVTHNGLRRASCTSQEGRLVDGDGSQCAAVVQTADPVSKAATYGEVRAPAEAPTATFTPLQGLLAQLLEEEPRGAQALGMQAPSKTPGGVSVSTKHFVTTPTTISPATGAFFKSIEPNASSGARAHAETAETPTEERIEVGHSSPASDASPSESVVQESLDAELAALLAHGTLAARGARSDVHARLGVRGDPLHDWDTFRSAMLSNAGTPRANSMPRLSGIVEDMVAAGQEMQEDIGLADLAKPKTSPSLHAAERPHSGTDSGMQVSVRTERRSHTFGADTAVPTRLNAAQHSSNSEQLPAIRGMASGQQVPQLVTSISAASVESAVAAERLKAKARAYLRQPDPPRDGAPSRDWLDEADAMPRAGHEHGWASKGLYENVPPVMIPSSLLPSGPALKRGQELGQHRSAGMPEHGSPPDAMRAPGPSPAALAAAERSLAELHLSSLGTAEKSYDTLAVNELSESSLAGKGSATANGMHLAGGQPSTSLSVLGDVMQQLQRLMGMEAARSSKGQLLAQPEQQEEQPEQLVAVQGVLPQGAQSPLVMPATPRATPTSSAITVLPAGASTAAGSVSLRGSIASHGSRAAGTSDTQQASTVAAHPIDSDWDLEGEDDEGFIDSKGAGTAVSRPVMVPTLIGQGVALSGALPNKVTIESATGAWQPPSQAHMEAKQHRQSPRLYKATTDDSCQEAQSNSELLRAEEDAAALYASPSFADITSQAAMLRQRAEAAHRSSAQLQEQARQQQEQQWLHRVEQHDWRQQQNTSEASSEARPAHQEPRRPGPLHGSAHSSSRSSQALHAHGGQAPRAEHSLSGKDQAHTRVAPESSVAGHQQRLIRKSSAPHSSLTITDWDAALRNKLLIPSGAQTVSSHPGVRKGSVEKGRPKQLKAQRSQELKTAGTLFQAWMLPEGFGEGGGNAGNAATAGAAQWPIASAPLSQTRPAHHSEGPQQHHSTHVAQGKDIRSGAAGARPQTSGSAFTAPSAGSSPSRRAAMHRSVAGGAASSVASSVGITSAPASDGRSRSPGARGSSARVRSANRGTGGSSILDTATEPASEPISIKRPLAWQERETRQWLEDLGLAPSAAEESTPLLDNPLRNGILLAALAARLAPGTGPGPASVPGVTVSPRDVRSARTNVLCALDALGLLEHPWLPPADESQRRRAQAAAADMAAAAAGAAGPGGTGGRSRSPSPARRNDGADGEAVGPTAGAGLGIISIKALGSAGRGYALRLKERQLRAGLGLVSEVEAVLAGSHDSVWGLLNFIRLVCAPNRRPRVGPAWDEEPPRRAFDVRGGPGPGTAPAAAAGTVAHRPTSPSRSPAAAAPAPGPPASVLVGTTQLATTYAPAAVVSPRKLYGALAAEQAAILSSRGGGLVVAHGGGDPQAALATLLHGKGPSAAAAAVSAVAASSLMPHGAAGAGAVASVAPYGGGGGLLYRPLWPSLAALPYSPEQLAALEASLLRWLSELGAITRREAAEGFTALLPLFADGTFICWLASNLRGEPIKGAHKKPLTPGAARANWLRAIEALRCLTPGRMSRRFLAYEEALAACERPALTGLLEDMHRAADGAPTPPSIISAEVPPYLPYVVPEPRVATLPPERLALNCGSPTATLSRVPSPPRGAAGARPVAAPPPRASHHYDSSELSTPTNHHTTTSVVASAATSTGAGACAAAIPIAAAARQSSAFPARQPRGGEVGGQVSIPGQGSAAPSTGVRVAWSAAAAAASAANGRPFTDKMVTPAKAAAAAAAAAVAAAAEAAAEERKRRLAAANGEIGRGPLSGAPFPEQRRDYPTAAWGLDLAVQQSQRQEQQLRAAQKPLQPMVVRIPEGRGTEAASAGAQQPRLRLVPAPP